MKVIGITGGVGSGKSEVLKFLESRDRVVVCQSDEVAKILQRKGTKCFEEIVAHFGKTIVGEDGELHRKVLADIVFHNKNELTALNSIVHPAVEEYIRNWIREEKSKETELFFLETALLIEANYDELFCDEVWYIYASDEVRVKRLKYSRGYSEEKIESIFHSQKTKEEYMDSCDRVIDNSRSFEETSVQLLHILDKISQENS